MPTPLLRRNGFGLALKPVQTLCVTGHGLWQQFQGHLPLELGVFGEVDLTHAAFTDLLEDFVVR